MDGERMAKIPELQTKPYIQIRIWLRKKSVISEYIVDTDVMPDGITLAQHHAALAKIQNCHDDFARKYCRDDVLEAGI